MEAEDGGYSWRSLSDGAVSSRGPQYSEQGRSYAETKGILSEATLKHRPHQLSKPQSRINSATRRMDYDDYEYYYNEDYVEEFEDFSYQDNPPYLARRQGGFSEQEELLELAGNTRGLTKEKVTKSGKNYLTHEVSCCTKC